MYNLENMNRVASILALIYIMALNVQAIEDQHRINLTSIMSKQAKLPCFVQSGRKFIWMQANRDEILSIDANVITGDRRFSIEQTNRCRMAAGTNSQRRDAATVSIMGLGNYTSRDELSDDDSDFPSLSFSPDTHGCWVFLIINGASLYDEGLYVCQIDTMTSTWVYLNILGKPRNFYKT